MYSREGPEPQYVPDPSAHALLEALSASTKGTVYTEGSGAAAAKIRQLVGSGPTEVKGQSHGRQALAPYLVLAAFVPLGLLLWRRDR